jgi:hypothetical protein
MDMLRVWPIVIQYGVGGVICAIGIWCGVRSGYVDLKTSEGKRLIAVVVGGYFALLLVVSFFTFIAPNWPAETP